MARVNIFDYASSISNESVSNADDKDVKVDGKSELPKQLQGDADKVEVDKDVSANASNTKTSEPGPENGGGDGTAQFHTADKAGTKIKMSDVDPKVSHIQTGGREVDQVHNKVSAKDGLSAGDVSTSVESHESDSEQSDLKSIDASGAEVVQAADDMVMDLDSEELETVGLTDAADKGISEADAAFAKAKELNSAAASVERYVGMLNRLDVAGRVLSPELRQSISWALESIDADLFRPERVALEAFDPTSRVSMEEGAMVPYGQNKGGYQGPKPKEGTIDDGEDPGEVSKGLTAKLKKIWEAAVRMFWRAVNAVVDAYHGLTANMPKVRDALADLRSHVKVLDGGTDFAMNGAHRLMIGDEFVGDSREAIDKVSKTAQELLMNWPNQLGKVLKDWKDGRPNQFIPGFGGKNTHDNTAKLIENIYTMLDRSFRGLSQLNPGDKKKVPSGLLNVSRLQWSGPLPGNRALYAGVNDDVDLAQAVITSQSVPINFSAIPEYDTHTGEITVTTVNSGEAVAIIRELEKLTHFIEDAKKGMEEIKRLGNDVFGDGVNELMGTGAEGPSELRVSGGLLIMALSHGTADSQNQFFGYLTGMIKAYMGYLSACIKAEGGGKDDIKGEATRVED